MKITFIPDFLNLANMFIVYYWFNKKNGIDKIIINIKILLLLMYFYGRIFKNPMFLTYYHLLLTLFLFLIIILSKDKEILLYISTSILIIIFTRKYFNGCLLRKIEKKSKLTDNKLSNLFNWDVMFLIIGLIANLKIHYYQL